MIRRAEQDARDRLTRLLHRQFIPFLPGGILKAEARELCKPSSSGHISDILLYASSHHVLPFQEARARTGEH